MSKRAVFRYAFKKSIPVLLGYVFLGIAFGIVLSRAGLSPVYALVMSVVIYAGSMEFALVPLLVAGTPLPTIALMTLMVNSRHIFYGLSFVDIFRRMGLRRPYMIFSLTDETYSVLCACKDDPEFRENNHLAAFYISALHHCYWVTGSVLGAVAGEILAMDTTGIDFSMTALFAVILVEQLLSGGKPARLSVGMALLVAVGLLFALGADAFLLPTLLVTVALLTLTNSEKEVAA